MGAKHQTPEYRRAARRVRDAANANPDTRCQRCGARLDQHPPHKSGKPATWHAGHIDPNSDELGPEASTCNITSGNLDRKYDRQDGRTIDWYNPPGPARHNK